MRSPRRVSLLHCACSAERANQPFHHPSSSFLLRESSQLTGVPRRDPSDPSLADLPARCASGNPALYAAPDIVASSLQ